MIFGKFRANRLRALGLGLALIIPVEATAAATDAVGQVALDTLQPLSAGDLSQQTGGAEPLSIALASNASNVTGNQIGGVGSTGVVNGNSLNNNSGLTTLIANSGNQVVISQSTIVNVFMH